MLIYIIGEQDYKNWRSSIRYVQKDLKAIGGVGYIKSSSAAITFPSNISKVLVHEKETSFDVITRITGKKPSFYSEFEIREKLHLSFPGTNYDTASYAAYYSKSFPTFSLGRVQQKPPPYSRGAQLSLSATLVEENIKDGDILLLRRLLLDDLEQFIKSDPFSLNYQSAILRNSEDF